MLRREKKYQRFREGTSLCGGGSTSG